ncbi:MAG: SIMPL domain-containing protein [Intrasporangium sp.]|uniref:SIMPL domain-containing protein n=1 Tax=Intrasporangium sp. TaxID=1925024 RepID=UPI00264752DC|nr:SIMPL domain-containing protein [Intrasporangium sp.]MDN5795213.1 SIMPL domain-containing protein [Intrasporangium sp.]
MGKQSVTVIGSGTASVSPDVVRLDLRVGHEAPEVASALSGAAAQVATVGSLLREHGVADGDIRTIDTNVHQRFDNTGGAVGFTAEQRLGVVVRDLDLVGTILEAAASGVGNALLVDGVRLDVADRSGGLRRARDAAFADAKDKAEQYAALSGSDLGEVLEVAESGAVPVPMPRMALAARDTAAMPMEGGDLELHATVTIRWRLG